MSVDPVLLARIEALERVFGCPRKVPQLQCNCCDYVVVELSQRRWRLIVCPRCGHRSLHHIATVDWPPQ